jgi:hypothetical protein
MRARHRDEPVALEQGLPLDGFERGVLGERVDQILIGHARRAAVFQPPMLGDGRQQRLQSLTMLLDRRAFGVGGPFRHGLDVREAGTAGSYPPQ